MAQRWGIDGSLHSPVGFLFSALRQEDRAGLLCLTPVGTVGLKGGQELYEGREGRKAKGNTAFTILLKSLPQEEVA